MDGRIHEGFPSPTMESVSECKPSYRYHTAVRAKAAHLKKKEIERAAGLAYRVLYAKVTSSGDSSK